MRGDASAANSAEKTRRIRPTHYTASAVCVETPRNSVASDVNVEQKHRFAYSAPPTPTGPPVSDTDKVYYDQNSEFARESTSLHDS